jgi:transcriptional regulator with PAS, ATPase and Fis domain
MSIDWIKEFPAAVTVCDRSGTIVAMNERSCKMFAKDGGRELIGKNLMACHPEYACRMLEKMLQQPQTHCYTTEKNGEKKLIFQGPWLENNEIRGLVELVFQLPAEVPNYQR